MDAKVLCEEHQLRNTVAECDAFARGYKLWVRFAPLSEARGAVEILGWKFAEYTYNKLDGDRPRLADAFDAAIAFLAHAPGCDLCDGTGKLHEPLERAGLSQTLVIAALTGELGCPSCRPVIAAEQAIA